MVRVKKDEGLRKRGAILFDIVEDMTSSDITSMLVRLQLELQSDRNKLYVKQNAVEILEQELECRGERVNEEPY